VPAPAEARYGAAMQFGLTYFPTDRSMRPDAFARAAEERGFESIWLAEHSHIPVTDATPGPPEPGQPGLPREYYAVADPFVSLALAAAATTRLKLATGICLVPQRDVFQTAKQVASLDLFSGGRFLFGVGGGWNRPEIANHGTDPARRFAVMRERIEAMQRLWSDERAEYHGEHVDFGPCYAWPKPLQRPHPPIHVGGAGLRAIRRAVRYGDGWVPLMGAGADDPVALLPRLREALATADRDGAAFEVSIYFCPPDPAVVDRCREGGIDRVLFPVPSRPEGEVRAVLDGYAKLQG
jgi:probable F420-dependent oxidoreductase